MTLADLNIFFLLLLGGDEMRPSELTDSGVTSAFIAVNAMVLPFTD